MGLTSVRTLLFTDIERSTALLQRVGPRYPGLLERHRGLVHDAVHAAGGEIRDTEGDGTFSTFASPSLAVQAAVDAQRALLREPWPEDARVRVRMGIHSGEVIDAGDGVVGLAVHHGARIAGAGHGGQIVVSQAAAALVNDLPEGASLRSLGEQRLRDVGPIRLYQVVHPDLPADFPPLRAEGGAANNLPAPLTSLVGRDAEVAEVHHLLDHHRLVTLAGAGGSGKTRLALRVASELGSRFHDGIWFVELAGLTEGDDVPEAVRRSLGLPDRRAATSNDLASVLADRQVAIVLDNCEHLIDACAGLAGELLARCPRLVVLATSREPLGLPGEAVFRVPSLALPPPDAEVDDLLAYDAARLFVERAALVKPGYRVTRADAPAVVEIVRRLDGIPLAIELAAARMRALAAPEIAERLDDRFRLLTGGARNALPRQQTLRATVDWSYRLLSEPEQALLVRLAVFSGGCDLDAVESVCAGDPVDPLDVLDLLTGLQDKSLVWASDDGTTSRYRLPETIRQYAKERLVDEPDAAAWRDRHARWATSTARHLGEGPDDGAFASWLARLERERGNLRAAATWLLDRDAVAALELLAPVYVAYTFSTQLDWHAELVRLALDREPPGPPALLARALAEDATHRQFARPSPGVAQLVDRAAALMEGTEDGRAEAEVLAALTLLRPFTRREPIDATMARAACDAADGTANPLLQVWVRLQTCRTAPPSVSDEFVAEALAIAERHDHQQLVLVMRAMLATAAGFSGRSEEAVRLARQIRSRAVASSVPGELEGLSILTLIEAEHGDLRDALTHAEDLCCLVSCSPHDRGAVGDAEGLLAHIRRLLGDLDGARDAARLALDDYGDAYATFTVTLALTALSAAERLSGHPERAAAVLARRQPPVVWWRGATDSTIRLLEEWAAVARDLGDPAAAADLLATATWLRLDQQLPVSPARRPEIDALGVSLAPWSGRVLDTPAVADLVTRLGTVPA